VKGDMMGGVNWGGYMTGHLGDVVFSPLRDLFS
jgi:hypothetical protein